MKKQNFFLPVFLLSIFLTTGISESATRQSAVTGGPNGITPYLNLSKGSSQKRIVETARDHQWSLQFHKSKADTVHIVAIRIEFAPDTSYQTTGNGLFGMRLGGDKEESKYYESDTVYKYDALPHDSLYFSRQLESAASYFNRVSRGNLTLTYSIYPSGNGQKGYSVDSTMPHYSPGGKRRKESWDEYYERKTLGLITFVKDAIIAADKKHDESPFKDLHYDEATKTIRDNDGHKTVFMIFHAGSSYLTDGGKDGSLGQDSPSDMIDAFITPDIFNYFRDTLKLSDKGVFVNGADKQILIDELMMCSETSNQDGLNWGIQGIIVNQIARQLSIPDLYSTSSGISGIGAFCIMDFAGYSAGNGFIPPYPSAWVRAFMGWDEVNAVPIGKKGTYHVKALTSILDRDTTVSSPTADTTILLVPLNDHEYYLIENRQRNLAGDRDLFNYDTIDTYDSVVISSYPYVANLDKNVVSTSGKNRSNVILRVKNNDIGIPASGLLVWHVDENIIKNRLALNGVNADSAYRGVSLVEADGIKDLGIMFQDIFYQAAFDYGGAEDVFPHTTRIEDSDTVASVSSMGPYSFPSTRANDGGHTYLDLSFSASDAHPVKEMTALGKNDGYHFVENVSDSLFSISVQWNYLSSGWPKRAVPGRFFDPLLADIAQSAGKELFLLDSAGRVYVWPASDTAKKYNSIPVSVDRVNLLGDTIHAADTLYSFDTLGGAFVMPSAVADAVMVPSKLKRIFIYRTITDTATPRHSEIALAATPSSALCNYHDSAWAIGCSDGHVIFGTYLDTVKAVKLPSDNAVCAVAALRESPDMVAAIQIDGTLSLVTESGDVGVTTTLIKDVGIAPFTLVTADLDKIDDDTSEIIVTDSRQGMWVFKHDLTLAPGWMEEPSDWPSYYTDTVTTRKALPVNGSAPALADIDRDGYLDIIVGGTNGLYAFNYKGALKSGWPAYLDKYYWYQRGSITSSPVIVTGNDKKPLILFSSLTGDNATYRYTKVIRADRDKGIVWFKNESGTLDSIWDLKKLEIDTILTMSDSLIAPYTIPGGLCDAVNAEAKRPRDITSPILQSRWPLTTGSSLVTSPMIGFMDANTVPDLFAVSADGWIYRWELPASILPDTLFWPQNGYNAGRSFAFGGAALPTLTSTNEPISFFSFPNPATRKITAVTFKYRFSAPATNVKLSVYSYTGNKMYAQSSMGLPPDHLTGSYPDWNVHIVSIKDFPPGVYRCNLEATVDGKKRHQTWKMAIIK